MQQSQVLIDLNLVLTDRDDGLARTGASIIRHRSLPHPQLDLLETRYPREIARARFQAIHNAVIESWSADPASIGRHFRAALVETFSRLGRFLEPGLIRVDCEARGPRPDAAARRPRATQRRSGAAAT